MMKLAAIILTLLMSPCLANAANAMKLKLNFGDDIKSSDYRISFVMHATGPGWSNDFKVSNMGQQSAQEVIEEAIHQILNQKTFDSDNKLVQRQVDTLYLTLGYRNQGLENPDIVLSTCNNIKIKENKDSAPTLLTIDMSKEGCRYLLQ